MAESRHVKEFRTRKFWALHWMISPGVSLRNYFTIVDARFGDWDRLWGVARIALPWYATNELVGGARSQPGVRLNRRRA